MFSCECYRPQWKVAEHKYGRKYNYFFCKWQRVILCIKKGYKFGSN